MFCAFLMHNIAQVLRRPSFYSFELILKKSTPISHLRWIYLCFNWFGNLSGWFRLPKTRVRKTESSVHSWCPTLRMCCTGLPFILLNSLWRNWLQYRILDEYIFVLIDLEMIRVCFGFRNAKHERSKILCILDAQLCASVAPAFLLYCITHCEEIDSNIAHRMNNSLF